MERVEPGAPILSLVSDRELRVRYIDGVPAHDGCVGTGRPDEILLPWNVVAYPAHRAHAIVHAAITPHPSTWPTHIDPACIIAFEEQRVRVELRLTGSPIIKWSREREEKWCHLLHFSQEIRTLITERIKHDGAFGDDQNRHILDNTTLVGLTRGNFSGLCAVLNGGKIANTALPIPSTWDDVLNLAERLDHLIAQLEGGKTLPEIRDEQVRQLQGDKGAEESLDSNGNPGKREVSDVSYRDEDGTVKRGTPQPPGHPFTRKPQINTDHWARMVIERPPLNKPHVSRAITRKVKPRDFGDSLRFPDRMESDEKVFGNHRRARGGTVLVDHSGSMSLSNSDVQRIIDAAPSCTIASYSTQNNPGILNIIAHGGMTVSEIPKSLGGNGIDGPALEWLSWQRKPLLWVSDGGVTGRGAGGSAVGVLASAGE